MTSRFEHQGCRKRNPFKSKEGYAESPILRDGPNPFGWSKVQLDRKIRERCIARGITNHWEIMERQFAVYSRIERDHPTLREKQAIWRKTGKIRMAAPALNLSKEEMERLVEKLEGANEPILIDIYDKISAVLNHSEKFDV